MAGVHHARVALKGNHVSDNVAAIHAPFQQFEPIDMALRRTIGEAVRTVMVTSLVIRTCSITRSERSGMNDGHWLTLDLENVSSEDLFGSSVYHMWHQRACVRTIPYGKLQLMCVSLAPGVPAPTTLVPAPADHRPRVERR